MVQNNSIYRQEVRPQLKDKEAANRNQFLWVMLKRGVISNKQ